MVMVVMAVPAVPVMAVAVMIPTVAAMVPAVVAVPAIVAVPAAMAPVVMMAARAVPAMMVATIGRLGDACAEQGEKRDGGSNNGLHRLTFLATDNGREAAPMPFLVAPARRGPMRRHCTC